MGITEDQAGEAACGPPGALAGAVAKEQIPGEPENLKTGCGAEHSPSGFSLSSSRRSSLPAGRLVMVGSIRENWLQKLPSLHQPTLVEPSHSDPNLATSLALANTTVANVTHADT